MNDDIFELWSIWLRNKNNLCSKVWCSEVMTNEIQALMLQKNLYLERLHPVYAATENS